MQKRVKRRPTIGKRKTSTVKEHTVGELYLYGVAGIIGLGILVLPVFIALFYGGPLSVYLVIGAGFIALLIAILIYDISLTHSHDPYRFLKETLGKEYSFIFGFLLLVSFIITITAAGIASVGELSLYFGLNIYLSIAIVDIAFLLMWGLLSYNRTGHTISGLIKIFFVALLIIIGLVAVATHGSNPINSQAPFASLTGLVPISLALLVLLWMYGGFEGISIAYNGKDRSKVARALIYTMFTLIVIFTLIQFFVYETGGGLTSGAIQLNLTSVFTTNVITSSFSSLLQEIIIGLSIVVILTMAFTLMNSSSKTLNDMAKDGLMPRFLVGNQNMKLLVAAAVPIFLITIFSNILTIIPGTLFVYIPIIILSALSFAAAFAFFAIGYGFHYTKSKTPARSLFGFFVGLLLIALILLSPVSFLIGLGIIIAIAIIGYILLR
ncbi:MAG: APC family permease [Candidatus Parvarchaeota archaeon]|nr:APC family permease [Candidatus Parvarchaeota archaeon]